MSTVTKRAGTRVAPSEQPTADQILRAIRRILRQTAEHSRQLVRVDGLSVPQVLCLRAISQSTRSQRLTVAAIALLVQLSNATVSRILDRLELAGLLVRERSVVDRRKVYLRLTPKGRQRVKRLPESLHEQFVSRLIKLPKSEQRAPRVAGENRGNDGASDLDAAPMLVPHAEVKTSGHD